MGCMLCYAAVILIGLDVRFLYVEEYTFVCNVRLGGVADCVKQPLKTKKCYKNSYVSRKMPISVSFRLTNYDFGFPVADCRRWVWGGSRPLPYRPLGF